MIVDEVDEEGAIGRSAGSAPEIDGAVYLNGETNVQAGRYRAREKWKDADEYDLWAVGFNATHSPARVPDVLSA